MIGVPAVPIRCVQADSHVDGARYTLQIAGIVRAKRSCLKGGGPSCDKDGVAGDMLRRAGITVVRVPRATDRKREP